MTIDLTIIGLSRIVEQDNQGGQEPGHFNLAMAKMPMQYLYNINQVLDYTYPTSTIHCSN